ncbi:glycosyltransferase family 2 protein [Nocardioides caricicola]|uniref:Glycosyltransferase family 2 protein n=1 Tax=Nocardioides caricicola TaxID=634770 RepID=A0ABW0MTM4_9ACTN
MTATYRVSLAMIVRDEARCIERCLESVRELVDEMVVVDTGSTDDTVALAEAAGATVHHVTWADDFAAARNVALGHCTGDWVLVLDADEWLVSGAEVVTSLRSAEPVFTGAVEIASPTSDGTVTMIRQVRVLPSGARYTGRIHEQPDVIGEERALDVRLEHDGYLAEQLASKAGRNRRLLEMSLAEDPENPFLWFQLARAHDVARSPAAACLGFERAYQLTGPTGPTPPPWRHPFVVRFLACLVMTGRTQDAIDFAVSELEHWQGSADFQFMLGHALHQHALAHPELQPEVLPLAEDAWLTCLSLGDSSLPGATIGHGTFLAARQLVSLYESLGREPDAARLRPLTQP